MCTHMYSAAMLAYKCVDIYIYDRWIDIDTRMDVAMYICTRVIHVYIYPPNGLTVYIRVRPRIRTYV